MRLWDQASLDAGRGVFDGGGGFTYTPYFDGPGDEAFGGVWFWHPCSSDTRGRFAGPNGRTGAAWTYTNTDDPDRLTIRASILCVECGFHGFLTDGVWANC